MFVFEFIFQVAREFVSLTVLVLPYFLLGAVAGALLEVYVKPELVLKYLGKGTGSVINATVLGAILPGCSCATMPMAEGLKASGARLGTIGAFIMVSPLLSPHTLILNYGLLGWKFTLARIVASLVAGVALGMFFNLLEKKKISGFELRSLTVSSEPVGCEEGNCGCTDEHTKSFWKSLWGILKGLSKYFFLGMAIASIMTTLIPEEAVPKYIGSSGIFAYATAVLVGIPLYVCEGEEIPITLALLQLGLGMGPSFTFLLGAVGTCLPTMIMAQKIIGKRPTGLYIVAWFIFAIGAGILFQVVFGSWK